MLAGHHPALLTVAFQTSHDQSMLSLVSRIRARFAIGIARSKKTHRNN
jgi:hypothetical protein